MSSLLLKDFFVKWYVINIKFIQVFLLVCMNNRNVHSTENCTSNDCHVFDWLSWSVCVGDSGSQSQYRERHMCCDDYVRPHDLEHYLNTVTCTQTSS